MHIPCTSRQKHRDSFKYLFHRAITTGKRVRAETHISYNAVSVSYAAVQLAQKVWGTLEGKTALIFGAGQMAELTVRNLVGKGLQTVFVANRHLDRAVKLAETLEERPSLSTMPWKHLNQQIF